ncbi:calpain-like cysteine peptidase [Trypanosoma theileri]|uniref:Calpain-like cysteine peptidase n=1 Tax=Trypanosoma theileri TaxID=67003 RepID=A0A1X0NNM8_9TRYP|nr:calpain-like cysteine peptidase [Trypanosoma theileri]ORC86201.1 calpain-like cysteine peptidase [Trypanosoma theileri]
MSTEALSCIQNGMIFEREGRLGKAEEWYVVGIQRLRVAMQDTSIGNSQKMVLGEYLQDAARSVQRIRETRRRRQQQQEQKKQPLTNNTVTLSTSSAQGNQQQQQQENDDGGDYLSFLDGQSENLTTPNTTSLSYQANNNPPAAVATPPPLPLPTTPTPRSRVTTPPPQIPPTSLQRHSSNSLAAHFAPRASDLVMKAIDVATILTKQKEYKRAVDVLQHAYDMGRRERNRPANFNRIEEHLLLLRREYYNRFKPRFLQDNPVLPEEMEILRKSGITSTILLPIWDDLQEGYGRENVFMPCEGHWEDSFTPRLSSLQRQAGAEYLRIGDIKPDVELSIIHTADPLNVKQTVVGDCSMVCSLIICASYQQRFPKGKIINNVIFPQDNNGDPVVNPKGKYCVKMLLNGMTRLITVDDRFPANPRTRGMLCTYSRDKSELWVSIMEKAFVKVCGGSYDFPGSSSSGDLYKLSGWLPDGIMLDAENFDPELHWNRLYKRHVDGSVLITASTPALSEDMEKKFRLASSHAYAVLGMREIGDERLLELKNPWGQRSWNGAYSISDKRPEAIKLLSDLQYTDELADQGVFWITWSDLCKHFFRCSLSWNPYMLFKTPEGMSRRPTRLSCHSRFPYTLSVGQMPQYHIGISKASRPSRMHLVFSRHITDVESFGQQFEKDHPGVPYVALKVYDVTRYPSIAQHLGAQCTFGMCYCRRLAHGTELEKVLEPLNEVIYKSVAAHTVSFTCPAGTSNLLVLVSRLESTVKEEFSFSLTLHTEWSQIKLNEKEQSSGGVYMHAIPRNNLKYCSVIQGNWVKGVSCGGRSDSQTFVYNPQYLLSLLKPSMISVRLCTAECEPSVQVHVVKKEQNTSYEEVKWSSRIGAINSECNLLLQAPLYAHGGVVVDTSLRTCLSFDTKRLLGEKKQQQQQQEKAMVTEPLPPLPSGNYTIIPAQWVSGVPASFELVVETTEPHKLQEIPPEGSGFKETVLQGELKGGSAGNPLALMPTTDTYFSSNSKVCIVATSPGILTGRLLLLLKSQDGSKSPEKGVAINVSLFRSKGAVSMELIASSGSYDPCSVALPPVKVDANTTYVLIVSSAKPSHVKYVLRLYSSCVVSAQLS